MLSEKPNSSDSGGTARPRGLVPLGRMGKVLAMLTEIAAVPPVLSRAEQSLVERLTLDPPRRCLTVCEAEWIEAIHTRLELNKNLKGTSDGI